MKSSNVLMQEQHWGIMCVRVYVCAEDKNNCECELSLHTEDAEHCLRRKAKYSEPLIGNMCRSVWANSGMPVQVVTMIVLNDRGQPVISINVMH